MSELTPRQRREVGQAIRHVGRAMRALNRANLPDPTDFVGHRFPLHNGVQLLAKASDALIDAMEIADPSDGES